MDAVTSLPECFPEDVFVSPRQAAIEKSMKRAGLWIAAATAGAALLWALSRKR